MNGTNPAIIRLILDLYLMGTAGIYLFSTRIRRNWSVVMKEIQRKQNHGKAHQQQH